MNGPEHYREAERLLAAVVGDDQSPCLDDSNRIVANTIAAAQVHATLALAAATALADAEFVIRDDTRQWMAATVSTCPPVGA